MFTGIIEEIGTIKNINLKGNYAEIKVNCKTVLSDVHIGDSIALNGICLTVTEFSSNHFSATMMKETLDKTATKYLKNCSKVNLERAMSANGRFGGHIVSGHVDGIGFIKSIKSEAVAKLYTFETSKNITKYIITKGSITINGTSLTVTDVTPTTFTVSLIPHTLKSTVLGSMNLGDYVNLECDILGKYVEKLLFNENTNLTHLTNTHNKTYINNKSNNIDLNFLSQNGFY